MGKIIKDIVEDTFITKNTNIYELSILMGVDSFDYMVTDSRKHLQALKSYDVGPQMMAQPSILQSLIQEDGLLALPYRAIRAGWASGKSTLVPQRLYNEQKKTAYLEQATELGAGDLVLVDSLPDLALNNIYAVPQAIVSFIRQSFPACRLFHISTALLAGIRNLPNPKEGHRVYAHLKDGLAFLSVFDGSSLLFFNAFPFQSAKDFIYFLLLAYQQFGLKQERAPAYLSGQLVEDSEIFREAFRYLKYIHFTEPPPFFHLGPKLSREPKHFFFGLLGLSLCG